MAEKIKDSLVEMSVVLGEPASSKRAPVTFYWRDVLRASQAVMYEGAGEDTPPTATRVFPNLTAVNMVDGSYMVFDIAYGEFIRQWRIGVGQHKNGDLN